MGVILQGEYSARQLRAFMPCEGTALAKKQEEYEEQLKGQNSEDRREDEDKDNGENRLEEDEE